MMVPLYRAMMTLYDIPFSYNTCVTDKQTDIQRDETLYTRGST